MRVRCVPVWIGASALAFSLATAVPAFAATGDPVAPVEGTEPPPATPDDGAPASGGTAGDGAFDPSGPSSGPDEQTNEDSNWDWDRDGDRGSWYWSHDSDWYDHHDDWDCSWDGQHEHDWDGFLDGEDSPGDGNDEAPAVRPAEAAPSTPLDAAPAPETVLPSEAEPPAEEPAAEDKPTAPAPVPESDVAPEPGDASLSYLGELSGAGATVALASSAQPGGPLGVLALLGGLCVVGAATVGRIAPPDAAAQFRRDVKRALRSRRPTP